MGLQAKQDNLLKGLEEYITIKPLKKIFISKKGWF